jgi:hypothetical protein
MSYRAAGVPLLVIAGKEYGTGSSDVLVHDVIAAIATVPWSISCSSTFRVICVVA